MNYQPQDARAPRRGAGVTDHMSRDDPMRRSGATWCEQHARWECSKRSKRTGGRCHASAIRGMDRCRSHAGESTARAKAKGEALSAWSALAAADADLPELVDPARAVMAMLHMSWLRVHLLAGLLEQQVARDATSTTEAGDLDAAGREDASTVSGVPGPSGGLVGHVYAADKQAGIFATGEAVRALVQLEAGERDRCVRFAKVAHDMGIADREIELAEAQTRMVAVAFTRALEGLPAEQVAVYAQRFVTELRGASEAGTA